MSHLNEIVDSNVVVLLPFTDPFIGAVTGPQSVGRKIVRLLTNKTNRLCDTIGQVVLVIHILKQLKLIGKCQFAVCFHIVLMHILSLKVLTSL